MDDVLQFLRKSALIFGANPDKSLVTKQIEEMQSQPPAQVTGGADGATSIIHTLFKSKNKDQNRAESVLGGGDGQTPYEYRGENPNAKSDGLDSGMEMAGLGGSSVNKIGADETTNDAATFVFKLAKPVGGNVSMNDVKGPSTQPKARGTKVLLRTPASVKLSSFVGGLLGGFSKAGAYPDVDPGLMFEDLVRHLPTETTPEERAEIKTAFVANWGK